ncbi:hypothetical protein TNCV_214981 [Trichonephila clavipes]|nr:hypothetical protein TNCV_214981 [Trichonephila clavipes]
MAWGAIGYTFRSPLVCIDGALNSARYISGVLRPVSLPFVRALRKPAYNWLKRNPFYISRRGSGKNGKSFKGTSKTLVGELLPTTTAPNAEVYDVEGNYFEGDTVTKT